MSLAKKCDRCHKLYEHYPKGNKSQANAIARFYKAANGDVNRRDNTIDLCPECMNEFDKFMTAYLGKED